MARGHLRARARQSRLGVEGARGGAAPALRRCPRRLRRRGPGPRARRVPRSADPRLRPEDHRLLGRFDAPHPCAPAARHQPRGDRVTTLRIAVLAPDVLDSNGDAANARVLAARARWSGVEAEVVPLATASDAEVRPDVLVAGTGADEDLPGVLALLHEIAPTLRAWVDQGTQVVAVGAGWEMLAGSISTADGGARGIGLFPGDSVTGERATDDLLVETPSGVLVGFENHERRMTGIPLEHALGRVLHGTGDGAGHEGYAVGGLLGTHLHGPVLAKNPSLADAILRRALGDAYSPSDERLRLVDETARAAREVIAKRLGVGR
ncbi:cobyric acid synthase [Rathayibacter sp. AY1C1]|nr:cobyric acid synthase [Rathayibacter sp. AY1C1]